MMDTIQELLKLYNQTCCMKKWIAFGIMLISFAQINAQSLPSKKNILESMRLANQYFMDKWPDAGKTIITNKERQSHIWTRAVYYEGLMALYSLDPQKTYYDYAVQWGEKHHWGLVGGVNTRHADNHCAGQTYIDLYLLDKKEERIKDIKASIDMMVHSEKKMIGPGWMPFKWRCLFLLSWAYC